MSDRSTMDQLDAGIERLLAGAESEQNACDPEVTELLAVAARLRELPRPDFKAQLKDELLGLTIPRRGGSTARALPADILPTLSGSMSAMYPVQRKSFMAAIGAHALIRTPSWHSKLQLARRCGTARPRGRSWPDRCIGASPRG